MSGIWIRSQDKQTLVYANDIYTIDTGVYASSTTVEHSDVNKIGDYATKERAIEVINEIEDKLGYLNDTEIRTPTYHMPKD